MPVRFTAEWLRENYFYDPKTGEMFNRFKTRKRPAWSKVGRVSDYGRVTVNVTFNGNGGTYRIHRLAWLYVYGEWPPMDVDHRDNNPANNRIENLRLATDSQNLGNMKRPVTNKSGKKGVSWHRVGKKWQAHVKIDGVNHYLGLFETVELAHDAYCKKASECRGEFARFE